MAMRVANVLVQPEPAEFGGPKSFEKQAQKEHAASVPALPLPRGPPSRRQQQQHSVTVPTPPRRQQQQQQPPAPPSGGALREHQRFARQGQQQQGGGLQTALNGATEGERGAAGGGVAAVATAKRVAAKASLPTGIFGSTSNAVATAAFRKAVHERVLQLRAEQETVRNLMSEIEADSGALQKAQRDAEKAVLRLALFQRLNRDVLARRGGGAKGDDGRQQQQHQYHRHARKRKAPENKGKEEGNNDEELHNVDGGGSAEAIEEEIRRCFEERWQIHDRLRTKRARLENHRRRGAVGGAVALDVDEEAKLAMRLVLEANGYGGAGGCPGGGLGGSGPTTAVTKSKLVPIASAHMRAAAAAMPSSSGSSLGGAQQPPRGGLEPTASASSAAQALLLVAPHVAAASSFRNEDDDEEDADDGGDDSALRRGPSDVELDDVCAISACSKFATEVQGDLGSGPAGGGDGTAPAVTEVPAAPPRFSASRRLGVQILAAARGDLQLLQQQAGDYGNNGGGNNQQQQTFLPDVFEPSICPSCDEEMTVIPRESLYRCPNCYCVTPYMCMNNIGQQGEEANPRSHFEYRRVVHFASYLAGFQAKESRDVPKEVYETIQSCLQRMRKPRDGVWRPDTLKNILKRNKLSDYYENLTQIWCEVNQKPAPKLTKEQEQTLCAMFQQLQPVYKRFSTRINFIFYPYVVRKLCEIQGYNDIATFMIPEVKSKRRVGKYEKLWRRICKELGWKFIPCNWVA